MSLPDAQSGNRLTRGYGALENFLARKRAQMTNRLIPENLREGRILDIGCGTVPYFLLNTKFAEKVGIDPAVNVKKFDNTIVLHKIAIDENTPLPFADNYFNVITLQGVIGYFTANQYCNLLKEIRRVMKTGGRVILTVPHPSADRLLKVMPLFKLISPEEMTGIISKYNRNSLTNHFQQAGFRGEKMCFGYFEMFLNTWAFIDK